jgi:pSer/pThr/pTyr-binding forkhead associated (FHA) protein
MPMMHLEVGGRTYPIAVGELAIGADPDSAVALAGPGVAARAAVIQGLADGGAAVRAIPGSEVTLNGVRLGGDPTPVLHGDKLRIGETDLLVVDARRIGRTQVQSAIAVPDATAVAAAPSAARGGGRLVCLTDGREYAIGDEPLVFGREAGADVVVPGDDVSRRHAEIRHTDGGYVVVDLSANGTFVNGDRVQGARPLVRADILRIGSDEFRFYAPLEGPPPGAVERLSDTMHGIPATPLPSAPVVPPPIASLLGRSGAAKGTRFPIRTPMASVGRGEYNDIVLPDASVSTMHAKLQRRDGVWMVVDLGSTNGTFVDDEAVRDDVALSPGATIRFGEVSLMFEPLDEEPAAVPGDTRSMAAAQPVRPGQENDAGASGTEPRVARARVRPAPPPPKRSPVGFIIVLLTLAAAAAAAFMLLT